MPRAELSAEIVNLVRAAVQPETLTLLMIDVGRDRWIVLHGEHTGANLKAALDESWTLGTKCGPGVLLLEAYAHEDGTAARQLRAAGVEVWIGLGRDEVVGVLLLGPRRTRPEYFAQQLRFLEALGPIIAAALEIEILHERQLELERARARDAHLAHARAESLATFQRMTQALAHEIGNPLTPIKALAKILPERRGDSVFAENFSRIVAREVERIERLVSRLRRVTPHSEASFNGLDLRVPMRYALEVIEVAATNQGTRLEVSLHQVVPVLGDIAALEELFLNLLTNALEAVAQQSEDRRRIEIAAAIRDGFAVAEVRDSGPGISVTDIDKIFDPFMTTKPRGSGLGLAICSAIADHHHGRIAASNVDGGGAVFTVTLPLALDRPPARAGDTPEIV